MVTLPYLYLRCMLVGRMLDRKVGVCWLLGRKVSRLGLGK